MSINDLANQTSVNIIRKHGVDITFTQGEVIVELKAMFSPNATEPPTNVGYSNTVSKRRHSFYMPVVDLQGVLPTNGDIVTYKERQYVVEGVEPFDDQSVVEVILLLLYVV